MSNNPFTVTPVAGTVPFDNATNGFTSTEAQSAIEEAKSTAIAKPRFTIVTSFNSTITNNQWLGYNELVPGNTTPIYLPVNCVLKEVTVAYNALTVSGVLVLYKNGLVSPTNVFHSETFTLQSNSKVITGLSQSFSAGDYLVGRWTDTGNNPSDAAIVYYFQIT